MRTRLLLVGVVVVVVGLVAGSGAWTPRAAGCPLAGLARRADAPADGHRDPGHLTHGTGGFACIGRETSADATRTAVHDLDGHGEVISEIVRANTAIASQSNLLALNAAVEAARAGAQSRGVAVAAGVAEAVRSQVALVGAGAHDVVAATSTLADDVHDARDGLSGTATVSGATAEDAGQILTVGGEPGPRSLPT